MREIDIYRYFLDGHKTAYSIHRAEEKQNPKAAYGPIHDNIINLAKKGTLTEFQKEEPNPRRKRWFRINTAGLARLYTLRKKDTKNLNDYEFCYRYSKAAKEIIDKEYREALEKLEALDFHHSKAAKEIIDKEYREALEKLEALDFHHSKAATEITDRIYQEMDVEISEIFGISFHDDERGKLFKKALSVSPSMVDFFEKEKIKVRYIKDPDMFSYILKNTSKKVALCFDVIPNEKVFLYKIFLGELLPIDCLARDYEEYGDNRIKSLLGEYLLFQAEKRMQDVSNNKIKDSKERCSDNLVLYIPPVGTPVLAHKGYEEYPKK